MWEALLGAIIGGLLTIAGQWMQHHYAGKRDQEKWEREEKRIAQEREFERQSNEEEEIRSLYADAIRDLSTLHQHLRDLEDNNWKPSDRSNQISIKARESLVNLLTRIDLKSENGEAEKAIWEFMVRLPALHLTGNVINAIHLAMLDDQRVSANRKLVYVGEDVWQLPI